MTSGCWRGPAGVALRSTAQGPHSRPVFLHLHGGAFSAGTPIGRDPVLRLIADRSEAVVFDLDYSMIPERTFPQAVHEAVAPLAHIRCNADVWGLDDSRLVIGGGSAGGNLSAAAAMVERDAGNPTALEACTAHSSSSAGSSAA